MLPAFDQTDNNYSLNLLPRTTIRTETLMEPEVSTTVKADPEESKLSELQNHLSWLASVLGPDGETITISKGYFTQAP